MKQEHNMVIELQTPGSGFTALTRDCSQLLFQQGV
jgi:hypothetical protein